MAERVRFISSAIATTRQPVTHALAPSLPFAFSMSHISLTTLSILYLVHANHKRRYSLFHLSTKNVGLQAFPSSPTRLQQRVNLCCCTARQLLWRCERIRHGRMLLKIYTSPIPVKNVISSLHSVIVLQYHKKDLTLEFNSFDAKFIRVAT